MVLSAPACTRQANIYDAPETGPTAQPTGPTVPDAGVPIVDSGIGADAYAACGDRPSGECQGSNDFLCVFGSWVSRIADHCQRTTDCHANGWFSLELADDGCVSGIGMTDPEPAFIDCVEQIVGTHSCPCSAATEYQYLGLGNSGCVDAGRIQCASGEFQCPSAEPCVDGYCVTPDGG
jgi:hypothetical protein